EWKTADRPESLLAIPAFPSIQILLIFELEMWTESADLHGKLHARNCPSVLRKRAFARLHPAGVHSNRSHQDAGLVFPSQFFPDPWCLATHSNEEFESLCSMIRQFPGSNERNVCFLAR